MERMAEQVALFCDVCDGESDDGYKCMVCGKDFCCNCWEKHGKTMQYSVYTYITGSNDGNFCNKCREEMPPKYQKLYASLLVIQALGEERKDYEEDFYRKVNDAESLVKQSMEGVLCGLGCSPGVDGVDSGNNLPNHGR